MIRDPRLGKVETLGAGMHWCGGKSPLQIERHHSRWSVRYGNLIGDLDVMGDWTLVWVDGYPAPDSAERVLDDLIDNAFAAHRREHAGRVGEVLTFVLLAILVIVGWLMMTGVL